jgi:hypothetical protein
MADKTLPETKATERVDYDAVKLAWARILADEAPESSPQAVCEKGPHPHQELPLFDWSAQP